ncbi:DNA-directed RNA polymerase subunit F [archaeon]|nr:MAG: DNA-directed RNA polymerase subunit F [archaeon]
MIGKKIIDEQYVTQARAKEILEKREEGIEPLYEQKTALIILNRFTHITASDAEEMVEKIREGVPRIKTENIVKIVDLMPQDKDDLNVLFSKERVILTDDEVATILEIVDNYR